MIAHIQFGTEQDDTYKIARIQFKMQCNTHSAGTQDSTYQDGAHKIAHVQFKMCAI